MKKSFRTLAICLAIFTSMIGTSAIAFAGENDGLVVAAVSGEHFEGNKLMATITFTNVSEDKTIATIDTVDVALGTANDSGASGAEMQTFENIEVNLAPGESTTHAIEFDNVGLTDATIFVAEASHWHYTFAK